MSFKLVPHWEIKSASQLALATYWDQLSAGRRFPAFTELKLSPRHARPQAAGGVECRRRRPPAKFRARYQARNVAEAFNSAWAGKTMEQVVPMSLRQGALEAATECAASGCVVYSIFSTIDANDTRVDCHRLLLPFGRDDTKVEQMLASLQLIDHRRAAARCSTISRCRPTCSCSRIRLASPAAEAVRPAWHGKAGGDKRRAVAPRRQAGGQDQFRQAAPDLHRPQRLGDRRGDRGGEPCQHSRQLQPVMEMELRRGAAPSSGASRPRSASSSDRPRRLPDPPHMGDADPLSYFRP